MVCRGLRCVVTEKRFILKIYRSSLPLREESRSDASRVAVHLPVGRGLYQAGSIAGAQTCAHLCARFSLFVLKPRTLRINVRKVSRRKSTKPVKGPTLPENRRASDGVSRVLSPLLNESPSLERAPGGPSLSRKRPKGFRRRHRHVRRGDPGPPS